MLITFSSHWVSSKWTCTILPFLYSYMSVSFLPLCYFCLFLPFFMSYFFFFFFCLWIIPYHIVIQIPQLVIFLLSGFAPNISRTSCTEWKWSKFTKACTSGICATQPICWVLPGGCCLNIFFLCFPFHKSCGLYLWLLSNNGFKCKKEEITFRDNLR